MAELEGNVLRPPGVGATKTVSPPEEILYSYSPPPLIKGGTVKAGKGIIRDGEPMKLEADGKTYEKVATPFTNAVGVCKTAVDCTTEAHLINIIFGGTINAKVQAITAANAAALATALGGVYNARLGFIKF